MACKIKIVWIGFHEEGVLAFRKVAEQKESIVACITLDDEKISLRSAGTNEYEEICGQQLIPLHRVKSIKEDGVDDLIKRYNPDLLVVLGWSEILPERLLEIPTIGTVGTHASLLPHNRGSAPVNWAIIRGEEVTGNTLMWLDKEVDTGKIINQIKFEITRIDTCKTVYDKVAQSNLEMIWKLICSLEQNSKIDMVGIENETEEPLLPRRRPKDGQIDWDRTNEEIYNFIRALTKPYPGAFSYFNGEKVIIWNAAMMDMNLKREWETGEIIGKTYGPSQESCGIVVGCGKGAIILNSVEINEQEISGYRVCLYIEQGRFKNNE